MLQTLVALSSLIRDFSHIYILTLPLCTEIRGDSNSLSLLAPLSCHDAHLDSPVRLQNIMLLTTPILPRPAHRRFVPSLTFTSWHVLRTKWLICISDLHLSCQILKMLHHLTHIHIPKNSQYEQQTSYDKSPLLSFSLCYQLTPAYLFLLALSSAFCFISNRYRCLQIYIDSLLCITILSCYRHPIFMTTSLVTGLSTTLVSVLLQAFSLSITSILKKW